MSRGYTTVQWNQNKKIYDFILIGSLVMVVIAHFIFSSNSLPNGEAISDEIKLLRALGDTGFILLNVILAIGPLARLDMRLLPLLYNRRHMGVTFFLLTLIHGVIALFWYHSFGVVDPLTSLFSIHTTVDQVSDYPFQPLGFMALLIFFIMAATSHDFWNATLGPRFWKGLHMLVYAAYALIILHIALGPLQSDLSSLPAWSPWASLVWVGGLHVVSALKNVNRHSNSDSSPLEEGNWIEVEAPETIEEGSGRVVSIKDSERIAVFRTSDNQYGAISNVCRHQAGPLGEGCILDGLVTCPWHGFQYHLEDGRSPAPFSEKVETYKMMTQDDKLYVNIDALPPGTERPLTIFKIGEGQ